MFNLVKYELKGYYKELIIILGVIILANMFLFTRVNNWQQEGIVTFSLMITFAVSIAVFIWNIRIFSRDMYGDSGYLMFTLPQSGYSILGAKLITAVIQATIVWLVAFIFNFIHLSKVVNFNGFFTALGNNVNIGFASFMVLGGLFEYIYFLLTIYFSISLSKVAIKKKKMGKMSSFIIFVVLSIIIDKITQLLTVAFPKSFTLNILTAQGQLSLGTPMGIAGPSVPINIAALIFTIISLIAMYLATSYIIENKLDF